LLPLTATHARRRFGRVVEGARTIGTALRKWYVWKVTDVCA
jgi:hypothetical protein